MGVKLREKPKGSGEWWIFIDHQGKRKAKKIGKDKKTAREVARKIEAKFILGELDIEKPDCPPFKELAETWMALPHDWSASTIENYRMHLVNHAFPAFGKVRIDKIKRKDLKDFFDKLYVSGLCPSTVIVIKAPIAGVFMYAVESDLLETNPMREVILKYKKNKSEIDPLDESEASLLLEQIKVFLSGLYYPVTLCGLRTGMRIGEMQALHWQDIDFENRTIEVRRSFRKGVLSETKNKKRRRVDMSPMLSDTLERLKTSRKREALRNGKPVSEFVFTGTNKETLNKESFRYALNQCTKKAGLKRIRIHDLRHSYSTIRLMRGHNPGDVSYQLGHSSIKITYDVYAHWIPGKFKSEVDELDTPRPSATQVQPETDSVDIL